MLSRSLALLTALLVASCGAPCVQEPDPLTGIAGENCPARQMGSRLGVSRMLVGGNMDDASFSAVPFDIRYVYLVGPVPTSPCASCAHHCSVEETSCANDGGGCPWWGCWQWDGEPPGRYVANFIEAVETAGAIPMFTYYVWLSVAGTREGPDEIAALGDPALTTRYLADWRFFCETVRDNATGPVIVHLEPDLWGFAEQVNADPAGIPAAVRAAVAPECTSLPDTLPGLSRCMLAIARSVAPGLLVGFHASSWGAGQDVNRSEDAQLDVALHARQTADFLAALGAGEADLIVVEMSDRDAGAGGFSWDVTNSSFPNFDRAVAWVTSVSTHLGVAPLWWQVPYGHQGLDDTCDRHRDNRVDYIFDHPQQLATGGAIGIVFGAGAECMTAAESDDGHFLERAAEYYAGERPCLCGVCR